MSLNQPPHLIKSRSFDFVERNGLEKLTDTEAGNWHHYILKELIDNALDADESHNVDSRVDIQFRFREPHFLVVRVSNNSPFPLNHLENIFSLKSYFSMKDYVIGVTRGKQGNGLKTILGIPYALKYHSDSDFQIAPPLFVCSGSESRQLELRIDEATQTIEPVAQRTQIDDWELYSSLEIQLVRFCPEPMPSVDEIVRLAKRFALVNADATFTWSISIGDKNAAKLEYPARAKRRSLIPFGPVSWYQPSRYRRLVESLSRDETFRFGHLTELFCDIPEHGKPGLTARLETIQRILPTDRAIPESRKAILDASNASGSSGLCAVGKESFVNFCQQHYSVDGVPVYEVFASPTTASDPFVIEAVMLRTDSVESRTLDVQVNHSPLLKDPFYRKRLPGPAGSGAANTIGLPELLDKLQIERNDSVLLSIHIIAPTIEFQSFGKGEFDCHFLEDALVQLISSLCSRFNESNRLNRIERAIAENLVNAATDLQGTRGWKFTIGQLLHRAHRLAVETGTITADARLPDARRFRTAILHDIEQSNEAAFGNLIYNDKSVYFNPSSYSTIVWCFKAGLGNALLRNQTCVELRFGLFIGDATDETASVRSFLSHVHLNRTYDVLFLHDARLNSVANASQIAKKLRESKKCSLRFHDLGLRACDAEALDIPGMADTEAKWPEESNTADWEQSGFSIKDYKELYAGKIRYDLSAASPDKLLDWMAGRFLELGVMLPFEAAAIERSIYTRILAELKSGIRSRLCDRYQIDMTSDSVYETIVNARKTEIENFADALKLIDPDTWTKHIADFVERLLRKGAAIDDR